MRLPSQWKEMLMAQRPKKNWIPSIAAALLVCASGAAFAVGEAEGMGAAGEIVPVTPSRPSLLAAATPRGPGTGTVSTTQPSTRTAEEKKQEDVARVMTFFQNTQLDVYEQANALRASDPAKFDKLIADTLPTVDRLEMLKKNKPKLFELSMKDVQLNYKTLRLAHELKRTDLTDADRKQIKKELQETVAQEFDVQQKIRQYELDELKGKVRKLDDQLKVRESDKGSIIQKRADDLIKGTTRSEW
jgi:hypothetical protein